MKKKEFALSKAPVDMILSVHVRNLCATYGEKKVRKALKELFKVEIEEPKKEVGT